jgi:hypothetical protein
MLTEARHVAWNRLHVIFYSSSKPTNYHEKHGILFVLGRSSSYYVELQH